MIAFAVVVVVDAFDVAGVIVVVFDVAGVIVVIFDVAEAVVVVFEVVVVVATAVTDFIDFWLVFVWFDCLGCFFGLAGGVFFGEFVDLPLIETIEPRLFDDILLIAPVFDCTGVDGGTILALVVKLFCRGGEQPK